jgi:UPF0755 protein
MWSYLLSPMTANLQAPTQYVEIRRGTGDREIGEMLAKRRLVHRWTSFVLAAHIAGVENKMQAGVYSLSPAMTPGEIARRIALGLQAVGTVTIPEGFTVQQIAARLAEDNLADEARFLVLAQTEGRTFVEHGFRPPSDNLEGYLFPDTYTIPQKAAERDIIALMVANFERRVVRGRQRAFARYPGGLSAAVTLASLVEREARVPQDRPLIAAALTNRLRAGMRLQCDATVQYVLPRHKARLFYADLRIASPYNTYLHAGLPPGPICCPGLPSIQAALVPARVPYLYYVAGPDGRHVFSRTLSEHNRAVARMRRQDASKEGI